MPLSKLHACKICRSQSLVLVMSIRSGLYQSLLHRISNVNEPGYLLDIEEHNEHETMTAPYAQQIIDQRSTTSAAYQYEMFWEPRHRELR